MIKIQDLIKEGKVQIIFEKVEFLQKSINENLTTVFGSGNYVHLNPKGIISCNYKGLNLDITGYSTIENPFIEGNLQRNSMSREKCKYLPHLGMVFCDHYPKTEGCAWHYYSLSDWIKFCNYFKDEEKILIINIEWNRKND